MTVNINSVNIPGSEILRSLIVDGLSSVISDVCIVDEKVPVLGTPILAMNAQNQGVFVFFDLHDAQHALMTGLASMQQIKQQHRMVGQLYPQVDITQSLLLVIMTSASIVGDYSYFQRDGSIMFYTFRGMNVNNEIGILIETSDFNECLDDIPEKEDIQKIERDFIEKLEISLLSEEENKFFSEI